MFPHAMQSGQCEEERRRKKDKPEKPERSVVCFGFADYESIEQLPLKPVLRWSSPPFNMLACVSLSHACLFFCACCVSFVVRTFVTDLCIDLKKRVLPDTRTYRPRPPSDQREGSKVARNPTVFPSRFYASTKWGPGGPKE